MAQRIVYSCDRCGAPGAVHLDLEVGVTKVAGTDNDEDVEIRMLDLCLACSARALKLSTDGMGHAVKRAWIDAVLGKDATNG